MKLFIHLLLGVALPLAASHAQSLDHKRIVSEGFPADAKEIQIREFLDPAVVGAVGSRAFKIWIDAEDLDEADFYLRVSSNSLVLEQDFDPDIFSQAPETTLLEAFNLDFLNNLFPYGGRNVLNNVTEPLWDFIYESTLNQNRYRSRVMNRLREYLLHRYEGWEVRFIELPSNRLKEFVVKANEHRQTQTATAFAFDIDPFGHQYRRPQSNRILASDLTGASGSTSYQWVRVQGADITYGDIHRITIPRPLNAAVSGDSYTSGEGAPLQWMGLPLWIRENWGR